MRAEHAAERVRHGDELAQRGMSVHRVGVPAGKGVAVQDPGRVVGVDDAGVMLEVAGAKAGERVVIAHEDLGPGRVQVEFNRLDEVADEELADLDDGVEDEER